MNDTRPALERLRELLPVHVIAVDEERGGLLRALLDAVGGELELLERDTDELYASWFVETAPEWVVPYIGDLVGVSDLPPDLTGARGAGVSRRAFIANTVAYRRRKGTAAVVEQVARDATGWPARAVEYYRLLATTAHVNHVRLDRPATASVRTPRTAAGPLELVPPAVAQGALDSLAHTADVRHIAELRGRYGIPNLGVFLFPDQVYAPFGEQEAGVADAPADPLAPHLWSPARPPADPADPAEGWTCHPLGYDGPLYAVPETEETIEHVATEADLPVPLRPRRLLALLLAARASGADASTLPFAVRVEGGKPLSAERLRVRGLEDLALRTTPPDPPEPLLGRQVIVDTVTGRLRPYLDGERDTPGRLDVRFGYGGTADVGAGPYDRAAVHADVLAADRYQRTQESPEARLQFAARIDPDDPAAVPNPLEEALDELRDTWAADPLTTEGTAVISIADNGRYSGDLTVNIPAGARLVLVAAAWNPRALGGGEVLPPVPGVYAPEGLRPHVRGTITVTGEAGSSIVLDGLTIEGDVVAGPGSLGSLAVSQCTVAGRVGVGVGAATNPGVEVQLVRSLVGAVAFGRAAAELIVRDSIVDPVALGLAVGTDPDAVTGAGLALSLTASTVRGLVAARTLEASSAILDGPLTVEHRQTGCVRYSFVQPSARAPRRFRCVPGPGTDPDMRPLYASVDPGSPHYLALAPGCPAAIAEGGEDASEMGVHHHLRRPVRLRAAARLLAPYVPVGLQIGVGAPVATQARPAGS